MLSTFCGLYLQTQLIAHLSWYFSLRFIEIVYKILQKNYYDAANSFTQIALKNYKLSCQEVIVQSWPKINIKHLWKPLIFTAVQSSSQYIPMVNCQVKTSVTYKMPLNLFQRDHRSSESSSFSFLKPRRLTLFEIKP